MGTGSSELEEKNLKKAVLGIMVSALLFGTMEVALKIGGSKLDSMQMTFLRFFIGGLVLAPFAVPETRERMRKMEKGSGYGTRRATWRDALPPRDLLWLLLVGFTGVSFSMLFFQLGVERCNASTSAPLMSTNPLFTMIIAHLFTSEKMNKLKGMAFFVGLAAIFFLMRPWDVQEGNSVPGIIFMLIAAGVSSCAAIFNGGVSTTMAGSYQSVPAQLDASDEAMTSREMALQNTIDAIETDYPDYDEYNYNLAEIGHNPFTLINYLSATKVNVVAADCDAEIESLFNEMYELTFTPREETRTRTVTQTNEETGEEEEVEEEYTVTILDVELTRKPLEDIVADRLTGNDDASSLYAAYQATNGALQQFYTPLDVDWYNLISSYYGYRKNPVTGENQFHRGIDIAVPEGTEVYAAQDGTVTTAEYNSEYGNYIVIEDANGFVTKYAHLSSMNVSAGQTVKHGAVIGKTGNTGSSTGSHLHLECLASGEYYNPLFYFENGDGSIYGTTDPIGGNGDVAALFDEAERYLGYPYVWGGSSPSTSFDCSGFVCYVVTHSGYYNLPRTTAQGIYNQCQHISASEANAGDIIFFTGTYNSGNPVTHVGIYAGNRQMIHCGDPIKYTSINTPYWQNHFYAFGRLPASP